MSKKWTREKELDLLINFYELSIDEAKERYDASYKTIAGRLEKLWEDESVEGVALLLEASTEVKRLKGILPSSTPKTRKEQRLLRKIKRLQEKLVKLQGDNNE
jgi:Flp pilus assembly CpaF family ATPase